MRKASAIFSQRRRTNATQFTEMMQPLNVIATHEAIFANEIK